MQDIKAFQQTYKSYVENYLIASIENENVEKKLKEAMLYSLNAGGKRIRPLLLFATIEALSERVLSGLETAAAIEMIHTYSLIHDDLPAMDNDDFRRGKLANHKIYGEGTAILAGDALLTYSFETITKSNLHSETKLNIIQLLAHNSGMFGMVGGQQADIEGENKRLSLTELKSIHRRKTGALLSAAILSGAIIGKATSNQYEKLADFAENIGIAFQICDDILDINGDLKKMGKKKGSDEGLNKSTYPSLLTVKGAKKTLEEHYSLAKSALLEGDFKSYYLLELAKQMVNRDH